MNKRIVINEIRGVIEYLHTTLGYGCLIFDRNEGYFNSCIGGNRIDIVDILDDKFQIEVDRGICSDCIYNKLCCLSDNDILKNVLLPKDELDSKLSIAVSKVNK